MKDHATPRIRERTAYQNYLRPRKLIQDTIRVEKFSEVTRRKKARAASAKILSITKQLPPQLNELEIEDYILTENQNKHDNEALTNNRGRHSLFKRTVNVPYHSKDLLDKPEPYRPKNHQEIVLAQKRIKSRRPKKKLLSFKLATAFGILLVVGSVSIFAIGPKIEQRRSEVNAQLYDEDMTVAGVPIDISNTPQVLGEQITVDNSGKAPNLISVPALNASADIFPVGLHPNGTLAQAQSKRAVGWYKASGRPGQTGTTLLTAYKDDTSPLNRINTLKFGDLIEVRNADGEGFWYRISAIDFYATRDVPMADLVSVNKKDNLVIIAPNGTWLDSKNYFSERVVITADPAR